MRRSLLDQWTKQFISWSNQQYLVLAGHLAEEQSKLQNKAAPKNNPYSKSKTTKTFSGQKPRLRNLSQLEQLSQDFTRYANIIKVWGSISSFLAQVQAQEQPYRRVADLVQHANRARSATDRREFQYDEESVIQVKGQLLASSLLLQCEAAILADFIFRFGTKAQDGIPGFNWSIYDTECQNLINASKKAKYPKEEVQGHILAAQVCLFARRLTMSETTDEVDADGEDYQAASWDRAVIARENESERRLNMALEHLGHARSLMEKFPRSEERRVGKECPV